MSGNSAIGHSWDEVREELYTPEEMAESNLRVECYSSVTAESDFAVETLESAELEAIRNKFTTNLLLCVKRGNELRYDKK